MFHALRLRKIDSIVVQAGAWACAAAKMVARNCRESAAGSREFAERVRMWVWEEEVDGRKLVRRKGHHACHICQHWKMYTPCSMSTAVYEWWCGFNIKHALPQTEIMNERHENLKYLPGVHLGNNIVACPDLEVRSNLPRVPFIG